MPVIKKHLYNLPRDADKDVFLMKQIAAGDERAFQRLFDMYYPQVRGFVLSFVKNVDDTEDIVQSVFIHLWQRPLARRSVICWQKLLIPVLTFIVWDVMR